ncbi:20792_t:CDS:2 [Entrophospora sp. SA101]|nr:6562_t:CDS:2 [Entrophospora sp. SA101]CAJ0745369.1 20792_t:CDS:2 [Entrophospora sp. SA101]CAJ0827111.1 9330_t:CDS:2 [Entrophospora sp. SA101]CAJ0916065.1 16178_t:CDS:2 [Entrophospora sp. SA101]CAJ0916083.1 16185_t:CDS:2 [Entrophospora sp. SA101]
MDEQVVGPQIGTSGDSFFQTNNDLLIQQRREAKCQNKQGDPIKCTSKVLCMMLSNSPNDLVDGCLYIGESGFIAKKIKLSTGKVLKIFKGHTGPVTCIGMWYKDQEEYLITGSWDKNLRKWNTKTKESIFTFSGHEDFVKSLVISQSKSILYSGSSDKLIRSWDLVTGKQLKSFQGHTRGIGDLALGGDGDEDEKFLYSASSDMYIRKWNTSTGECLQIIEGHLTMIIVLLDITLEHPDFVKCLAVAHPYVISGSRDETIRIFDIGSEELVDIIEAHYDEVSCLVVKGTMLYSGSLDGTIRKWSITAKDIAERIKKNSIKDDDDKISDSKPSTTTTDTQTSSVMTMEEELELEELLRDDEI